MGVVQTGGNFTGGFDVRIFGPNFPKKGDTIDIGEVESVTVTSVTTTGSDDGGLTYQTRILYTPQANSTTEIFFCTGAATQVRSGVVKVDTTGSSTLQIFGPQTNFDMTGKILTYFGPTGSGLARKVVTITGPLTGTTDTPGWTTPYNSQSSRGRSYLVPISSPVQNTYSGVCGFIVTDQPTSSITERVAGNGPRFG